MNMKNLNNWTMAKGEERDVNGVLSGMTNIMKEVNTNSDASRFVTDNYETLVRKSLQMGVAEESKNDIIHDVYMSYMKSEARGDGFDMTKGKRGDGIISLEECVYGRLKLYSKNVKYQKATEKPIVIKVSENGEYKYGNKEVACSVSTDDVDSFTSCQKVYNLASSIDSIEDIDAQMSIDENLNYVIAFDKDFDISVKALLSNLSNLKENIGTINSSIFSELKTGGEEFMTALREVVTYALREPERFDVLLQQYI